MSFLWDILEATRHAVAEREQVLPLDHLKAKVTPRADDRRFLQALRPDLASPAVDRVALIAEFKRSAPSSNLKHLDASVKDYVQGYVCEGASALSILTEGSQFGGSLQDLREAREAVEHPILRKDFVIGERQVYEAVEAGADAILLIAAVLRTEDELAALYGLSRALGLDALVEVRNQDELDRALRLKADLIGINNRNLETLKVDVDTTHKLVSKIPEGVTIVSESGLETRDQLDGLASIGVHAALIGSALMNDEDFKAKCREFTSLHATTANSSKAPGEPALA